MAITHTPIAVVGGGQAGLAMGYHLRRIGVSFVILDAAARTGEAWRSRWDTLRLFSLPRYASLPGLPIQTASYPTRDEMADYLERYAECFDLPIRHRTRVRRLSHDGSCFVLETTDGDILLADQVVVATGGHLRPVRPDFAGELDPSIRQLDAIDYRRATEYADDVLVVGAGTAGSDIAIDLARQGHRTVLAGPHPGEIPLPLDSLAVRLLMPLVAHALLHLFTLSTPMGRRLHRRIQRRGTPLIRYRRSDIAAAGVRRVGYIVRIVEGRPQVDDGTILDPRTVVWCTGFAPDHSWIDLPVFGRDGRVRQRRGVACGRPGLYFLGLSFQHSVASGAVLGLDQDARYLLRALSRRGLRGPAVTAVRPSTPRAGPIAATGLAGG
ncbi:MAG TPA: NAD(P)-binding domain-containing protein [Microlunatus sp.]|nr:NAD(P)-binding domain-containing protein [Microlunatus sp.]